MEEINVSFKIKTIDISKNLNRICRDITQPHQKLLRFRQQKKKNEDGFSEWKTLKVYKIRKLKTKPLSIF